MANIDFDKFLESFGVKWEELDTPGHAGERDELYKRFQQLQVEDLTIESIKRHIQFMRTEIEKQLLMKRETANDWVSLLALFFPLYGIIRRWYYDRHEIELRARLANYLELERMLLSPEKKREQLQRDLEFIRR